MAAKLKTNPSFYEEDLSRFVNHARQRMPRGRTKPGLIKSMRDDGFWPHEPLGCHPGEGKTLILVSGKNRFLAAQSLGIGVWWTFMPDHLVPRDGNQGGVRENWSIDDLVRDYIIDGNKHFIRAEAILHEYGMVGVRSRAYGFLAGTGSGEKLILSGEFEIADEQFARRVFCIYRGLKQNNRILASCRSLEAIRGILKCVPDLDDARLVRKATRITEPPARTKSAIVALVDAYNHMATAEKRIPLSADEIIKRIKGRP